MRDGEVFTEGWKRVLDRKESSVDKGKDSKSRMLWTGSPGSVIPAVRNPSDPGRVCREGVREYV